MTQLVAYKEPLATLAAQRAHYAAVKKRIAMAAAKVPQQPKPARVVVPNEPIEQDKLRVWRGYFLNKEKYEFEVERFKEILAAVSAASKIPASELAGPKRFREIARSRAIVYFLAKRLTALSFPQIGALLCKRDHTTILHGAYQVFHKPERFEPVLSEAVSRIGVERQLLFQQDKESTDNSQKRRQYLTQITLPVQS